MFVHVVFSPVHDTHVLEVTSHVLSPLQQERTPGLQNSSCIEQTSGAGSIQDEKEEEEEEDAVQSMSMDGWTGTHEILKARHMERTANKGA